MFKINRTDRITLMAAACAAAALFVAGCDASSDPNYVARKAGSNAAQKTIGAGDPKATDKLYELAASGATVAPTGNISEYVKTQGADKDLEEAIALLNGKTSGITDAATKSALESQLGAAQLELSQARFAILQGEINDLTGQSLALQNIAQAAVEMGAQAATLEGAKNVPTKDDADKAAAAVTQRQGELAALEAKARGIQDQVTAKEAQAARIFADTNAAFQAADALKGAASIAAGKKAMEDRRAGDSLRAEIGNLAPELARTNGELALAKVALNDAQSLAKSSAESYAAAVAANEKMVQRAATLRAAAQKIVNDPNGVKDRLAALLETAGKLDARVKAAASAADQATATLGTASSSMSTARSDARKIVDERALPAGDSIAKFAKDDRSTALIYWSQSAAAQQSGRVNLAGAEASEVAAVAIKLAIGAFKAANLAAPASDPTPNTYRAEAAAKFTKAADAAAAGNKLGAATSDVEKIKWIGYGLEATAQHGIYRATNNSQALAAAKTAQGKAAALNPSAASQLAWLDAVK